MNLSQLVTYVKSQGGFDATDQEIKDAIQSKYGQMLAWAHWRKAEYVIGTTVSGTANYDLPSGVTDLEMVRIGTQEYERVGTEYMWGLDSGRYTQSFSIGQGGYFAPDFKADGTAQVRIYPTPGTTGLTITGLAAIEGVSLSADSDTPVVPSDFHEPLGDGAIGGLLLRLEQRPDLATPFLQNYTDAKEALRRRQNSRIGSGPVQAQIYGRDFR